MKNSIIVILTFSMLFGFSTSISAANIGVGIKGGLSLGTLTGQVAESYDRAADHIMKPAFNGYGFLAIEVTDNLGAQLEIGYVNKGENYTDKSNSKNKISFEFSYLEAPLLIKAMWPVGIAKITTYAGPSFGYLLTAKMNVQNDNSSLDGSIVIPDVNGFDFGIALGAGSSFKAGQGSIVADIRYTIGLITVPIDADLKTGTLAFLVGYQYDF